MSQRHGGVGWIGARVAGTGKAYDYEDDPARLVKQEIRLDAEGENKTGNTLRSQGKILHVCDREQ